MATSLDGKIATRGREFFSLGSARDLRLLRKLRDDADAIVFGAGVLRAYRKACLPLARGRRLVNAVFSRNLAGVDPRWEFFRDPRIDRILFVTGRLPSARRAAFAATCEIVEIPAKRAVSAMLREFARRGYSRVGVEGGGSVMWPFVEADAIDEYYLTLTPTLVGGREAPTLVDGEGFDPKGVRRLRLKSLRRFGDEIFLVYVR